MMMAFIDAHREDLGIEPICRELAIAPSSYHEHVARLADPGRRPARAQRDDEMRAQIKRVHEASFGLYGMAQRVSSGNGNPFDTADSGNRTYIITEASRVFRRQFQLCHATISRVSLAA